MLNVKLSGYFHQDVLPGLLVVKVAKPQMAFLDLAHQQERITMVLFCLHNIGKLADSNFVHFHEDKTLALQIYLPFAAIVFL